MKLQLIIPHYHEPAEVILPLLDSLALQQNVDFGEIGVIIVHDGKDIPEFCLTDNLNLAEGICIPDRYPFTIEQIRVPHKGVSAARNAGLDYATAEYVMFCDCDDMFFNACGLQIVWQEFGKNFNALVSSFVEETRDQQGKPVYINHEMDSTFVHGKIFGRKYLMENNIRFHDDLTIHEDSYFNCLAQRLTQEVVFCPTPFYLWKWRDESVCRHDPKYILKTYNNMLDSSTALVRELLERRREEDAQFFITNMVMDAYYTMNKSEWLNQQNQEYRTVTEHRFARYYEEFGEKFRAVPEEVKAKVVMGMKNRFFGEGLLLESITFDDWIKSILKLAEDAA